MPQFPVLQLFLSRLTARLAALAASQRVNWPSWLAIGLGTGILLYFAVPAEPSLWSVMGLAGLCGVMALLSLGWRAIRPALWPSLVLLVIATGFAAACFRTAGMTPHFLDRAMQAVPVMGRIAQIEPLPAGARLTLAPAILERRDLADGGAALKLQVTVLTGTDDLQPGDWARLRADLHPPSGPAAPGAFDFRRQAFFSGVDGIGFSFAARKISTPTDVSAASQPGPIGGWADRLRQRIGQRIAQVLPDESGALAIALVVGNQTAMRKADMSAMRDSGLSHLLSISGLHISLAAGLVFFCCRFLLALVPWLALRIAGKKWAAVLGLLGATFYAVLAGAADPSLAGSVVPTQRSLFMVLIAFSAILLDRSPISLRLVAWSAVILLLWRPESLIGPSFQMSFAAVFALIACFEALRPQLTALRQYLSARPADTAGRVLGYGGFALFWLFSLMLSSMIASLATAPFGLYHFDRLQIYGIAANMAAVPLTGFWLMPAAVIALLLMPLGLDAPFWHLLGWGCDAVLWIARGVQHWPHAVLSVSAMPGWGLLAASAGLIWICLARGWHRAIGLAGVATMMLSMATMAKPDLLLSESGRLIALRDPSYQLTVNSNRIEKRVRETWLRQQGQVKSATFVSLAEQAGWLSCSYEDDCQAAISGHVIRFDLGRIPSDISCTGIDIIVVPQRRIACREGAESPLVIDQRDMARTGAIALYINGNSMRMETAVEVVGRRPWSAYASSAQAGVSDEEPAEEAASLDQ